MSTQPQSRSASSGVESKESSSFKDIDEKQQASNLKHGSKGTPGQAPPQSQSKSQSQPQSQSQVQVQSQSQSGSSESEESRRESLTGSSQAPGPAQRDTSISRKDEQINNQMQHITNTLKQINSELDRLNPSDSFSSHRIRLLQTALGDVESYRVDGIWVGRLDSGLMPVGQARVQDEFERTVARLEEWVLRDAGLVTEKDMEMEPKKKEGGSIRSIGGSQQTRSQGTNEQEEGEEISAELLPLYRTLSDFREQFRYYASKHGSLSDAELDHMQWLQYQLNHAESGMKHDGVWCGELTKGYVPAGQAKVQELVESCHRLVHRINVDCEEHVKKLKPAQPKPTSREKKMWQEMIIVDPSLRLLYRSLVDLSTRLSTLARRIHTAPSNTAYGEVEKIRHKINELEERYKRNGIWIVEDETNQEKTSSGVAGTVSDAAAAASAPVSASSSSFSTSTSKIPRKIPSGQAILNRLIDSAHDLIDRITSKRQ